MQYDEVIISATALDVPAENYEEFDQQLEPAKLGEKLTQRNPLKGSIREYQYYNSEHLLLNFVEKKNARIKKFRVNLACLSAEPEHNKVMVWKWLFSAISAAVLTILCLLLAASLQASNPLYFSIAGIVSFTAALICLLIFIYQIRDEYIFKSRFGKTQLFLMENKKPDPETFRQFFTELQKNITTAQANASTRDSLVNELKMCRRLRDEKIIDDKSYTAARTTIFKHEQYKA